MNGHISDVQTQSPSIFKKQLLIRNRSPILQSSLTYSTVTVGAVTVHPVATETVYRDTAGLQPITTSSAYNYYSGTVQPYNLTTTLPAIATSQNGSGVAATNQVVFDTWGHPPGKWTNGGSSRYAFMIRQPAA